MNGGIGRNGFVPLTRTLLGELLSSFTPVSCRHTNTEEMTYVWGKDVLLLIYPLRDWMRGPKSGDFGHAWVDFNLPLAY